MAYVTPPVDVGINTPASKLTDAQSAEYGRRLLKKKAIESRQKKKKKPRLISEGPSSAEAAGVGTGLGTRARNTYGR